MKTKTNNKPTKVTKSKRFNKLTKPVVKKLKQLKEPKTKKSKEHLELTNLLCKNIEMDIVMQVGRAIMQQMNLKDLSGKYKEVYDTYVKCIDAWEDDVCKDEDIDEYMTKEDKEKMHEDFVIEKEHVEIFLLWLEENKIGLSLPNNKKAKDKLFKKAIKNAI
jgi:hypothetical protein